MMATVTEHPLADLVRRAHDEGGLSYREMAARAQRAGFELSHSQLQAYAMRTVAKAPSTKQIRALAAALDMGYEVVRAAMFEEFYGYVPRELKEREGTRIGGMVPPDLPPQDVEELGRIIEAWLAARERRGGND